MATLFVGGGNMASALIAGAIRAGTPPSELFVIERIEEQRTFLEKEFKVRCISTESAANAAFDVVIWAVKPQHMKEAIEQIGALKDALHISIAAGLPRSILKEWLGSDRVVRTMPNSSSTIGAGVTGLFAHPEASEADRATAERLFAPTGAVVWVNSDQQIDAITAISGSGPAYVFHFLEGFQRGALELGFSAEQARTLVLQTLQGAVSQALASDDEFSTLRKRVTSERGTTAAAIDVFDAKSSQATTSAAVHAAFHRAQEIAAEWVKTTPQRHLKGAQG
ncbi:MULTISPECIES: pyrroline-5-carboxylate reductase [unclassified Acidovorax]|uniref:pyrroline-5-carboxylate reductase n=1 Tax=unclassified Acidovorax TaxID=2684926 RepID=UPI001C4394B7|nr:MULTISPECIES: pyrroline-5-carboxylate reductase [unclassified Acidovorax]MBV7427368.1 pyrroline-5-carboxylate reductase [Acidovorax sp. sif0732]MBV7448492.1 pyrroline-5-carboxylate reductase [Acidovorax sp. sif0715]